MITNGTGNSVSQHWNIVTVAVCKQGYWTVQVVRHFERGLNSAWNNSLFYLRARFSAKSALTKLAKHIKGIHSAVKRECDIAFFSFRLTLAIQTQLGIPQLFFKGTYMEWLRSTSGEHNPKLLGATCLSRFLIRIYIALGSTFSSLSLSQFRLEPHKLNVDCWRTYQYTWSI